MENNKESNQNVVDYLFYIISQATKDFTRKPTEEEMAYIYNSAQSIYGQCIVKEIKRWEEWKTKEEVSNDKQ
jgi:hypothetical protein